MEEKLELLLNKINMDKETYPYFLSAKLEKIKIHRKTKSIEIFISNKTPFPLEVIKELEEKKDNLDKTAQKTEIILDIETIDLNA